MSQAFARGARVVVRSDPTNGGLVGRTALVGESSHLDSPEAAVLSFDGAPGVLGLLPNTPEVLAPLESRPCLSLSPSCCLLSPCDACLDLLRKQMGAALVAGNLTGEQGERFVTTWNRLREESRSQMLEVVRQAREFALKASEGLTPIVVAETPSQAPTDAPPDEAPVDRVQHFEENIPGPPQSLVEVPSRHETTTEKGRVTTRRPRGKKDVPAKAEPAEAGGSNEGEAVVPLVEREVDATAGKDT